MVAAGYLALTVLVESGLLGRGARALRAGAMRAAAAGTGARGGRGGNGGDAEAGEAGTVDVDVAAERAALMGAPPPPAQACPVELSWLEGLTGMAPLPAGAPHACHPGGKRCAPASQVWWRRVGRQPYQTRLKKA